MSVMGNVRIAVPEIGQDMRNYVGALKGVGIEPVIVSVLKEHTAVNPVQKEYLDFSEFKAENYDGLMLPGGVDINPKRYGEENQGSINISDALDDLQFAALDMAVKAGIPVLGICRGHQIINVYFGGTMIQDLPTANHHAWNWELQQDRVHTSHANNGSWLSHIYGTQFAHNSAHHQAVGKVGRGLMIDSRCTEDGVVEAMHHETYPIISVQWHPERMCFANARTDTEDGAKLFMYFKHICEMRRKVRTEEHGAML